MPLFIWKANYFKTLFEHQRHKNPTQRFHALMTLFRAATSATSLFSRSSLHLLDITIKMKG